MDRLVRYHWPGNVRELQNIVERAVVLSTGTMLKVDFDILPIAEVTVSPSRPAAVKPHRSATAFVSLDDAERRHIEAVLSQTRGVIEGPAGAANIIDLHPNTLRSRMKKLGVQRAPSPHEIS